MCNLYGHTSNVAAIRALAKTLRDDVGNLTPLPGIYPDYLAPIVRRDPAGERELIMARWGMPGPPQYGSTPITNIRNMASAHWRGWLGVTYRCLVPFNSFCEDAPTKPRKTPTWFALDDSRPLAFFAGIWTTWEGTRGTKAAPITGLHNLFGFLTTNANAEVKPIHREAMPVILRSAKEIDAWMSAPPDQVPTMQRPLPNGTLQIVARGEREDGGDPSEHLTDF
jgi:putative SOS response-associated peptidase YedK